MGSSGLLVIVLGQHPAVLIQQRPNHRIRTRLPPRLPGKGQTPLYQTYLKLVVQPNQSPNYIIQLLLHKQKGIDFR
ncbi:hypothetical protein MBAV_005845 [Candidatus Magnetobacterium bavaricum]|uniref:Uncharacterized protein n=1 Tax=Candidatus Magnetobacterium bavaricum TaxID=29290 RepID=A0A0F3GJ97_9BACT|nr:hypothetical protein MBAV_005845 [Candidatus Magnetobacterium bavaricum]